MERGLDSGEQPGPGEALGEDGVAVPDDGVPDGICIGVDETVQTAVHKAQIEDVLGLEVFEALEEEFGWELGEGDGGVTPKLPRCIFALDAFGTLVIEGQRRSLVFERLIVIAETSWHLGVVQ